MDRSALSRVEFRVDHIKLRAVEPDNKVENQPEDVTGVLKVFRLIFFLVTICVIGWSIKYSIEGLYGTLRLAPYHITWTEMVDDFSKGR